MKVIADFGKIEYDVMLDYINEATTPPEHPLAPVYGAIGKAFKKEIRRRRGSRKKRRPAVAVSTGCFAPSRTPGAVSGHGSGCRPPPRALELG